MERERRSYVTAKTKKGQPGLSFEKESPEPLRLVGIIAISLGVSAMQTVNIEQGIHRTRTMFQDYNPYIPEVCFESSSIKKRVKARNYESQDTFTGVPVGGHAAASQQIKLLTDGSSKSVVPEPEGRLVAHKPVQAQAPTPTMSSALTFRQPVVVPTPQWHAPWELSAVASGHLGWVRSIAFDATNEWFVTGSADRTIKVWDLAKCCAGAEGGLKLTLTGHISAVRGLAVSPRHPYLFSAGEDKTVKCWDLEYNKVIRHYHGHLSAVFTLSLHPILDILVTGGRDSVARVWDMRTKTQIHVLGGHQNAISSIITNGVDPQIITGSHDSTVKLWDLAAGKCLTTLTHHKKAIRSMAVNPREFSFVTGGADNIKKWQCRDGTFLKNMSGHNTPINAVAVNDDGVLVSCGDNGSINFWDYETGYCFQKSNTIAQPGSLDAEAGIFAASFDLSGSRLITCEADKSIKIWKENANATEDTDPVDMKSWTRDCLALKKH